MNYTKDGRTTKKGVRIMSKLEIEYYRQFVNERGVLKHPKYDTFKEFVNNQKS